MDIKAAISSPVVQGALLGAAEGALSRVDPLSNPNLDNPAVRALLSAALEQALRIYAGRDPMDASAAFVMAATAYRAAVADWNAAKAAHPAKDDAISEVGPDDAEFGMSDHRKRP